MTFRKNSNPNYDDSWWIHSFSFSFSQKKKIPYDGPRAWLSSLLLCIFSMVQRNSSLSAAWFQRAVLSVPQYSATRQNLLPSVPSNSCSFARPPTKIHDTTSTPPYVIRTRIRIWDYFWRQMELQSFLPAKIWRNCSGTVTPVTGEVLRNEDWIREPRTILGVFGG